MKTLDSSNGYHLILIYRFILFILNKEILNIEIIEYI